MAISRCLAKSSHFCLILVEGNLPTPQVDLNVADKRPLIEVGSRVHRRLKYLLRQKHNTIRIKKWIKKGLDNHTIF